MHKILNKFHETTKYMCESRYRCDIDVHTVNSRSLKLSFCFAQHKNGIPTECNQACEKFGSSVTSLSPYTLLWAVQSSSHGRFSDLTMSIIYIVTKASFRSYYKTAPFASCMESANMLRMQSLSKQFGRILFAQGRMYRQRYNISKMRKSKIIDDVFPLI